MKNRFCVIGSKCSSSIDRTMKADVDAAVKHAAKLIGQQKKGYYEESELYVVEVIKVVRPVTATPVEVIDVRDIED